MGGSQAAERLQSTKAIRKEFQNLQAGLAVSAAKNNTLESDKYQGEVARIQQSLSEALKLNDDYYNQLDAKRTDWTNGASTALQNYLDDVKNVAKGTEEAFTNAFKSAEDSLTSFIMTGNWRPLCWVSLSRHVWPQSATWCCCSTKVVSCWVSATGRSPLARGRTAGLRSKCRRPSSPGKSDAHAHCSSCCVGHRTRRHHHGRDGHLVGHHAGWWPWVFQYAKAQG
ncbi:hypothetical protein H7F35_32695 [Variovorax sp. PAMC26660]|nr:hypothetical protein H7F35_32695 [Variovorax sp. PAMC26660]